VCVCECVWRACSPFHQPTSTLPVDYTRRSLTEIQTEKEREMREKNDIITQLTQRIQSMETSYESVLNVRLCVCVCVCAKGGHLALTFTFTRRRRWMLWQARSSRRETSGRSSRLLCSRETRYVCTTTPPPRDNSAHLLPLYPQDVLMEFGLSHVAF
jgi:hypothetical protein